MGQADDLEIVNPFHRLGRDHGIDYRFFRGLNVARNSDSAAGWEHGQLVQPVAPLTPGLAVEKAIKYLREPSRGKTRPSQPQRSLRATRFDWVGMEAVRGYDYNDRSDVFIAHHVVGNFARLPAHRRCATGFDVRSCTAPEPRPCSRRTWHPARARMCRCLP